jgi:hypothetical protein
VRIRGGVWLGCFRRNAEVGKFGGVLWALHLESDGGEPGEMCLDLKDACSSSGRFVRFFVLSRRRGVHQLFLGEDVL